MRIKNFAALLCVFVVMISIVIWSSQVRAIDEVSELPLTLKVISEKENYLLGEMVKLRFDLTNKGYDPISLPSPNVMTGYLKVWIAFNGQEFNLYNNSSWGLVEGMSVTIKPSGTTASDATILWNNKPQIPRSGEGKILTDYAFPKSGIYQVKAIFVFPNKDSPDTLSKIESEPIKITINDPVGDDLNVWNRIKNIGGIAYFIQQADTLTYHDEKAERLIDEVEQIVQEFPNSFLANQMKQQLEKFRVDDERRTQKLEKAKVKPNN